MHNKPLMLMIGLTLLIMLSACGGTPAATPTGESPVAATTPAEATQADAPPAGDVPPREAFAAYNLGDEPWASIQQQILTARENYESWANDPEQIARHFAINAGDAALVETLERSDTHAVMLITEQIAEDDSLAEQQIRLELSRSGEEWFIDWIGLRWKCRPGRGQQDWAAELCV